MLESRAIQFNGGLLSMVIDRLGLKINKAIKDDFEKIELNRLDRFRYNEEVNKIKEILKLKNLRFRTYKHLNYCL